MKNILILLLLFTLNCFSQTSTEKWNKYANRYEYFDRNGNMTAYKQYNSYLQQWETYKVGNSNNSSFEQTKVYSQFNAELAERAADAAQARYDNSYNEVVEYSKYLKSQITAKLAYNGFTDKDIVFIILLEQRFNNETLIPIWKKGYNYGDNSLKNAVKNVMVAGLNNLLKQTVCCPPNYKYIVDKQREDEKNKLQDDEENNTVKELIKYQGNYIVKTVEEYKFIGNKWVLIKKDNSETEFSFQNNYITFKRSYMAITGKRNLLFKERNYIAKCYIFESEFGWVMISDNFKTITLFDLDDSNGNPTNKYIYNL